MEKHALVVPIRGMHCRSCELLIETELKKIPEVGHCRVSFQKQQATIYYDTQKPNEGEVEQAVRQAGYTVGLPKQKTWLSRRSSDYKDLGIAAMFLVGAYLLLKDVDFGNLTNLSGSTATGLPVVFLVGITAGLSTCMALVGGLVLGISARHAAQHPEASAKEKFRPHLFFNLGRVTGYAVLGGVLGSLGSVLQLSSSMLGWMTILVGMVMLLMGGKLIGIFPKLEEVNFTLPSSIARLLGLQNREKEYSHRGAATLGALTFFLPCGFTQSMQLLAISSGSVSQGALIMGTFALGTAPGLLGVGGLASAVKGVFAQRFFKFAGLVVIGFAIFNISNGSTLAGFNAGTTVANGAEAADATAVAVTDGVQIVQMTESGRGYSPNSFTVKAGTPVKWIIDAKDPYSCAGSIVSSTLGIRTNLKPGENTIQFTPTSPGTIAFSCAMGMFRGQFNVIAS